MNRCGTSLLVLLLAATPLVACSKKKAPDAAAAQVVNPNVANLEEAKRIDSEGNQGGGGMLDPKDPRHGTRRLMGLDAGVFVDGEQVAVLRFGDLPPIAGTTLEGGAVRYRLFDYVKGLGIAPESVKSIHLHGNNDRIGSVEGSELTKEPNRFQFQFLSGRTGAAIARWDAGGLTNEFVVHEIRKVTIYVKKPSPPIDAKKSCHVGADGQCSDAVPYAAGDAVKGTRIYVDGRMVGFVKRRQLQDALLMGTTADGEQKYNVARLLAQTGVEPSGIKAVDLVAGDDVVAHADGAKFSALSRELYFVLPKHNHGKVRVHVPAGLQVQEPGTIDRDALVSSIQVFKMATPAARELSTISEDTDLSVQLASNTARE